KIVHDRPHLAAISTKSRHRRWPPPSPPLPLPPCTASSSSPGPPCQTSRTPHVLLSRARSPSSQDLMAASWSELPHSLLEEAKKAVSKSTDDAAGQEALKNVFRAAEACEEFGGVLVTLRMALDDLCGLTGENVGPLPGYVEDAVKSTYNRYMTYLESFGPDEHILRKKVENELGTKMIHLKMKCSGIGSEWGKITLIGTSGISGSYVELRA
uniref:Succinate dehydrogenase subunit 5, mitochondrial n=1 Tax=Aegilops tauschii subsp. strangulata TaxID=200361 RepID=A0A453BYL6_AEGTS